MIMVISDVLAIIISFCMKCHDSLFLRGMLISALFSKTSKEVRDDADSRNADFLVRGGYIAKTMAGVYSYLPLGLRVLRRIEQIVREEMNAIGGQEILLSALSSREEWQKTGRWDDFDALFHLPGVGDQEYALNPTHEEVIVPVVRQFVHSYRDLPFACYQIQTKFRKELRAKSGVLRGREFLMKDLYSFHQDEENLDEYYAKVQVAYNHIFERLGLLNRTYLTYASGGSFSKYSHEYQVLLPKGEDTIFISEEAENHGKRIAINTEIFEDGKTTCPVTGGSIFRKENASEAANIFKLGTRFTEPFGLHFLDENNEQKLVIMGCYGLGISRILGILAESFSDEKGLVWPGAIAPYTYYIIPLAKKQSDAAYKKAHALYEKLCKEKQECLFDDRIDQSAGSRFADADLLGVPTRIVVSEKTLISNEAEIMERKTGEIKKMDFQQIVKG